MRSTFSGVSIDQNMSDCVLRFSTILKNNDRNLVKSRSEFKVQEEILSLQFIVHETSPYICRSCVGKLRKRRGLYANVRKIEDELFSDYSSKAFKAGLTVKKRDRDTRKGQRRMLLKPGTGNREPVTGNRSLGTSGQQYST